MNNIAHKLNTQDKENQFLSIFKEEVENSRKHLFNFAQSLPKPLGDLLLNHFSSRLQKSNSLPMLGEYALYMIADLFNIKKELPFKFSYAWILLYEYTLLIDDMIDENDTNNKNNIAVSQILLAEFLYAFNSKTLRSELLFESFNIYMKEWINGSLHNTPDVFITNHDFSNNIFRHQSKRASIAKFGASSLFIDAHNRSLSLNEEVIIEHLCAGLMLLDDLTDVFIDFNNKQDNYLLNVTINWFRLNVASKYLKLDQITNNQLYIGLIYSNAIIDSWEAIANEIDLALNNFPHNWGNTYHFFHFISLGCRESVKHLRNEYNNLPKFNYTMLNINSHLKKQKIIDFGQKILEYNLNRIIQIIQNAPKACQ